jgi:hypothetical protein
MAGLAFSFSPDTEARVTKIVLGAPTFPYGNSKIGTVGQYEEVEGVGQGEKHSNDQMTAEKAARIE